MAWCEFYAFTTLTSSMASSEYTFFSRQLFMMTKKISYLGTSFANIETFLGIYSYLLLFRTTTNALQKCNLIKFVEKMTLLNFRCCQALKKPAIDD